MPVVGICPAGLLADPTGAGEAEIRAAGEAALSAGFTEASVWIFQLPALAGLDLKVRVVESALRWANGAVEQSRAEAQQFAEAAAEQGADLIAAVCMDPSISDVDQARRNLAGLVDAGASVGARVCLEFLPGTAVPDLATAWSIVEPLGPAGGILLDTWHWTRQPGGPAFDLLATIPGDRIPYLQLNDAAPTPSGDVLEETMTGRLLPGEGVVDYARLLAALSDIGAEPFMAVEIFNPGLIRQLGAPAAARRMKEAIEAVLAAR
ncbi:MAG TPA: sugar phosphate isomerase/epimerase [Acidimicrobiales bacterium]|nr:sugar phosphate isomerase/epimerase [Acidimicrobiales bacterium]